MVVGVGRVRDWAGAAVDQTPQISDLAEWVRGLDEPSVAPMLATLQTVDSFVEIALGYLSLDRPWGTLSGGETPRTKMIRHLGSSRTDVTDVFDPRCLLCDAWRPRRAPPPHTAGGSDSSAPRLVRYGAHLPHERSEIWRLPGPSARACAGTTGRRSPPTIFSSTPRWVGTARWAS
jgi:hypothetical protein